MPPESFELEPGSARLVVRTRAAGMLKSLAHDLEIQTTELRVAATRDEAGAWTAEVAVPVRSLAVAGALRHDRVDPSILSASDRADIERRLRDEVLRREPEVTARATPGAVAVTLGRATARAPLSVTVQPLDGGRLAVRGGATLSLAALGVREVKGPLGAFRVDDRIEIRFELTARQRAAG